MRIQKLGGLVTIALMMQACGNPFNISEKCENGFYTSDSGKRMHWPNGHRIDFELHKSVPKHFRNAIRASSQRYNETLSASSLYVIDSELNTPAFTGNVSSVSGDNVNGVYWVRDADWVWGESDPGAVAMTVVQFTRDGIGEADLFFRSQSFLIKRKHESSNPSALSFANILENFGYNPSSTNTDRSEHQAYMVGVHEFGHAIGRCHSSNPESIMYPEVGLGSEETREQPLSKEDIEILSDVYTVTK